MIKLERNVGRNDKNIRMVVGIVLILLSFFKGGWLLFLIGAIVLATGVFSFCGLYALLGMNTASAEEQASASNDLSDRATANIDDFKDEVVETAQEVQEKANEVVEELKEDVTELAASAKKKAGEFAEEVKEEVEELKEDAAELAESAKKKFNEITGDNDKKNS